MTNAPKWLDSYNDRTHIVREGTKPAKGLCGLPAPHGATYSRPNIDHTNLLALLHITDGSQPLLCLRCHGLYLGGTR